MVCSQQSLVIAWSSVSKYKPNPVNGQSRLASSFQNGSLINQLGGLAFEGGRAQSCSAEIEIDRSTAHECVLQVIPFWWSVHYRRASCSVRSNDTLNYRFRMNVQKETTLSINFNHCVKYQESSNSSPLFAATMGATGIWPSTTSFSWHVSRLHQNKIMMKKNLFKKIP